MLKNIVKVFGGDPQKRAIEENIEFVEQINALEAEYEKLRDEELAFKTGEFKKRLKEGETLDDLLIEAFAAVREASKRTLGQRHYDVQLIGGTVLHKGQVAEMRTGEGKTLVATLPLYLNALEGKGAHLVTVNDYLARRDARWMAPIFNLLGLSVGVLQMAARAENGKKAFLVDLEKESTQEDLHQLVMVPRKEAYAADITYGTNNEFGFDYLRDNMTNRLEDRVQRGHHYAIIDEVDNVLIDEARTPLIISGPAHDDTAMYADMARIVKQLQPHDYEVNERDRTVTLTEMGEATVERLIGQPLRDPERPEDLAPEQERLLGFLEQALRAQYLYRRNKEYLVQGGKVIIIDEHTGRLMPGRRWSDGLHQAVEAKEGVRVEPENVTYATITIQNYFRMYQKLAGMTGTALTEAEEFDKIYKLEVLAIPPNVEYNATRQGGPLASMKAKDEYGYEYIYYAEREDTEGLPVLWKRRDYPDMVYRTAEAKLRSIVREILQYHVIGRPILVGTTSVENSDQLSSRLRAEPLKRLAQTLVIRSAWMEANNREEDGRLIMALSYLNEPLETINTADMRRMAQELGVSLNVEAEDNLARLVDLLDLEEEHKARLANALRGGIPHEVLNARRHTEESQIIAGAGAFGAVTIATNMAGRGVDIKLGGEVAEEILSSVGRVLKRAGYEGAYDMSLEEKEEALRKLSSDDYGIYEGEIKFFLDSMEDMRKVKELGGLHVIGSERHTARRIDNQLRGRAARQGDPGSSRFYLSLQDEIMRLFGGERVDGLMQRLQIDDALPLENNLVSNMIEQSQTRVEGANFDARKHVLEYDDVLNAQRASIYGQRDRIFTKEDLSEDVQEMLETEINERVPLALADDEGPWRLLAWLEQIQPTFATSEGLFPSFTLKLLLDEVRENGLGTQDEALKSLHQLAERALEVEQEHFLNSISELLKSNDKALETQLAERLDVLDTFFEGLEYTDETDTRGAKELLDELSQLARFPLRLSNREQKLLREDPYEAKELVAEQLENFMTVQAVTRVLGAVERRLNQPLDLSADELAQEEWKVVSEKVLAAIRAAFDDRKAALIGQNGDGQIARDLEPQLAKLNGNYSDTQLLGLMVMMTQGAMTTFDKKTHQRVTQQTTRLNYAYYAAQLLEGISPEKATKRVLAHLQKAHEAVRQAWSRSEWARAAKLGLAELDEKSKEYLQANLDGQTLAALGDQPLEQAEKSVQEQIAALLGARALSEIYRQLLLRVISELWVDYLTSMEALRVSIGLEAYGQRDPLVQYKARAFEMFQKLFSDMRIGVVSRMFTYRPQALRAAAADGQQLAPPQLGAQPQIRPAPAQAGPQPAAQQTPPKKKQKVEPRKKQRRRK